MRPSDAEDRPGRPARTNDTDNVTNAEAVILSIDGPPDHGSSTAAAAAAPGGTASPRGKRMGAYNYGTSISVAVKQGKASGKADDKASAGKKPGWKAWVATHPWLFGGLVLLVVLGICAAVIIPSVCSTKGCRVRKHEPEDETPATLRTIVRFTDAAVTAKRLLPMLAPYFNSSKFTSSGLEVLAFDNLDMMKEVQRLLQEKHAKVLDLLVNDFLVSTWPDLDATLMKSLDLPQEAKDTNFISSKNGSSILPSLAVNGSESPEGPRQGPESPEGPPQGPVSSNSTPQVTQPPPRRPGSPPRSPPPVVGDPLEPQQWHLAAARAAQAWAVTQGLPEVVVAVMDTGVDLDHYDIAPNLWVNKGEIPGNGIDDDGNGFVDDVNGYDFGVSDSNPRPDAVDSGHGTHVSGLVAARRGNGRGGSGIAPNVRIMVLKVANGAAFYASNIMAAYDYAARMGAHVVSCSFGPYAPNTKPTQRDVERSVAETKLYERAVQPLAQKGVLLVAAAGNEDTDLDLVSEAGMSYLPCTLDLPNVICVSASDRNNHNLWREMASNRWFGTNYGAKTVDIAATGYRILSTVPGGQYDVKTGSSMATPIVSGAAALVLSVLGAKDGNFFQASRVRNLLLETGDPRPGLLTITRRVLNVERAVQAAVALGNSVLTPTTPDVAATSGALLSVLSESYYRLSPAAVHALAANGSLNGLSMMGLKPFGTGVRPANTRLRGFKYTGEDVMVALRGHLLLSQGYYTIRLPANASASRVTVTVGQRQLVWPAVEQGKPRDVMLLASQQGWYELEILYAATTTAVDILWLPPSSSVFSAFLDGMLGLGTLSIPMVLPHAPESLPNGAIPAGFQVLWHPVLPPPTSDGGDMAPPPSASVSSSPPAWGPDYLSSLSTDQWFKYSVFMDEVRYMGGSELVSALSGNGGLGSAARAEAMTSVGIALAYIQAQRSGQQLMFKVTCAFCALYLDDTLLYEAMDFKSPATSPTVTRNTPCVTLDPANNTASNTHTLQLRFALYIKDTTFNSTGLSIQYANCSSDGATDTSPMASLMAPGLWFKTSPAFPQPPPQPSLQCNVWEADDVTRPAPGQVMVLPQPWKTTPALSFRIPDARASTSPCNPSSGSFCPSNRDFMVRAMDVGGAKLEIPIFVRCWAWWSRGFTNGLMAVRSSLSLNTAVYLGGQRVFHSVDSLFGDPATNRVLRAPNATFLGPSYYQLLVMEWHGITPISRMSVVDGLASTPVEGSSLIIADMFAPR